LLLVNSSAATVELLFEKLEYYNIYTATNLLKQHIHTYLDYYIYTCETLFFAVLAMNSTYLLLAEMFAALLPTSIVAEQAS
jgi:hypothetical protein